MELGKDRQNPENSQDTGTEDGPKGGERGVAQAPEKSGRDFNEAA